MIDGFGKKVVAVIGGAVAKGMEVWSPQDNSVKLLHDAIPPEAGATTTGKFTFCSNVENI